MARGDRVFLQADGLLNQERRDPTFSGWVDCIQFHGKQGSDHSFYDLGLLCGVMWLKVTKRSKRVTRLGPSLQGDGVWDVNGAHYLAGVVLETPGPALGSGQFQDCYKQDVLAVTFFSLPESGLSHVTLRVTPFVTSSSCPTWSRACWRGVGGELQWTRGVPSL